MIKIHHDEKFAEWYETATPEERQHNSVWKFSLAMMLLSAIIFVGTRGQTETTPGAYEVRGVAKGAVQVIDRATGERSELHDAVLVKRALSGDIKRGDVIRY